MGTFKSFPFDGDWFSRSGCRNRFQPSIAPVSVPGLVIGSAAQPCLTTILGGMQIAIIQPIRPEDAGLVEGECGWVEEITLTDGNNMDPGLLSPRLQPSSTRTRA